MLKTGKKYLLISVDEVQEELKELNELKENQIKTEDFALRGTVDKISVYKELLKKRPVDVVSFGVECYLQGADDEQKHVDSSVINDIVEKFL